jgi:PEGA domain
MKYVAIVVIAIAASACATITRGTTQQFVVETTPPGASVKTSHGFTCPATPCTFSLQRKEPFSVTVSKDGFVSQTAEVKSEMAGSGAAGMAGNILVGGLIGIGVDATSGALNDLTPNPLQILLQPTAAPTSTPSAAPVAGSAPAASDPVG